LASFENLATVLGMRWRRILPRWLRDYLYRRDSRRHPGLRGQLMFEWSRATRNPLPEEERARIANAEFRRRRFRR
jgi:hypothetical protein